MAIIDSISQKTRCQVQGNTKTKGINGIGSCPILSVIRCEIRAWQLSSPVTITSTLYGTGEGFRLTDIKVTYTTILFIVIHLTVLVEITDLGLFNAALIATLITAIA